MPKYYCEYCDINLTHSSPAGRRQHNSGRRHINNKIEYYQQLLRGPDFIPPAHIAISRGAGFVNPANRFPTIMRPSMLARPPPGTAFVGGPGMVPPNANMMPINMPGSPGLIPPPIKSGFAGPPVNTGFGGRPVNGGFSGPPPTSSGFGGPSSYGGAPAANSGYRPAGLGFGPPPGYAGVPAPPRQLGPTR